MSVLISIDELARYDGPDLYLFLGISTAGSSVHRVFPEWAPILAPGAVLRGVDLSENTDPAEFRRLVTTMRDHPRVRGAVITSHKLRLHRAVADLLDHADPLVAITHEINALDTRDGRVGGYARDAQSLDLILDTTGTDRPRPGRSFVCIGAGGSAIALMLALGLDLTAAPVDGRPPPRAGEHRRGPLTILGRRADALTEIEEVRTRAGLGKADITLTLARTADEVSIRTAQAAPGTVIANATGLGKLEPGSPVTGPEAFAADVLAWDFNYRGPLTFLEQARAAGVGVEDGWDYFLAGWAAALAAIGGRELTGDLFDRIRAASVAHQPDSRARTTRAG